jgi:hypothetical protein
MRAQTATEYLVILAVVIIIALIVISTLGGIPGIANQENTERAKLLSAEIGISDYAVSENGIYLFLRNNKNTLITITQISVYNRSCTSTPTLPITLGLGQREYIICTNLNGTSLNTAYSYPITVTYTDLKTNAAYTIAPGNLIGTVGKTFGTPVNYRFLRWTITAAADHTGIGEFEVLLNDVKQNMTATGFVPWEIVPGGYPGQNITAALDGSLGTKWLDRGVVDYAKTIAYFDMGTTIRFNGYRYSTEPDQPERSPTSWTLEGSTDNRTWDLFAVVDSATITGVGGVYTQTFNVSVLNSTTDPTPVAARYLKWNITAPRNVGFGMLSASELQLWNNFTYVNWTTTSISNPGGSWPGGQEIDKLIDNNGGTKWLDFNTQSVIYLDSSAARNFNFDYYSFTPTDVTGREPTNWTFWSSTDNTTWTLIDNRTGGQATRFYRIQ